MARVINEGFEFDNELPTRKWPKKFTPPTLAELLIANSDRVLGEAGDSRAAFNFISKEGAFTIEPVEGQKRSWVVTVINPHIEL